MPVSPATVRESFPADDRTPSVADAGMAENRAGARKRRVALVGACILAFAVGFVSMTALTRGTDGAKGASSPHPKTTQPSVPTAPPAAPASSPAKAPASPPPSSALVSEVGSVPSSSTPQSSPPPMPRTENPVPPAPTTTAPAPTTTPSTTTPSTTTP